MRNLHRLRGSHRACAEAGTGLEACATDWEDRLAALAEKEFPHCGVFCQSDCPVVSIRGFSRFSELLQKVSAHCPVRLIIRYSLLVGRLENGESCCRSVGFRKSGGVSNSRAERWRDTE